VETEGIPLIWQGPALEANKAVFL